MKRPLAAIAVVLFLASASDALACFGAMLKVGVEPGGAKAMAAYALGYFVAEKTGIEPEFVETPDPASALVKGEIDAAVVDGSAQPLKGILVLPGGKVSGFGEAKVWLREDVKDDIRFTTVERALGLMPAFYSSEAYGNAARSGSEPKKAARKAVSDGT